MASKPHLILIGMPGSGKSSVGRCLAARHGFRFLDSDDLIEAGEGQALGRILRDAGLSGFCRIEAHYVRSIAVEQPPTVIATGGSVIYSESAMAHLKSSGVVVFLDLGIDELAKRLGDLGARGVVIGGEQSLADLFAERRPLYLKHAEVVFSHISATPEDTAAELALCLERQGLIFPIAGEDGPPSGSGD